MDYTFLVEKFCEFFRSRGDVEWWPRVAGLHEGGFPCRFVHQVAEEFFESFLAEFFLHRGDGEQLFLENVGDPGVFTGLGDGTYG